MRYFFVAVLFAFSEGGILTARESYTQCVNIRNVNYEKEIIKHNVSSPYQLAIHHDTNTLFYSYTARLDEMFKIGYLSLKTGSSGIVSGIRGGFATGINQRGGVVYMGGDDGIYEFDNENKIAKNAHIKNNVNIWQLFYKNGLYFTNYPDEKAFMYKDFNEVVEVPELQNIKVMVIGVTKGNNFLYSNSSGTFLYRKHKMNAMQVADSVINGITADIDGNLYYSTPNGLYYFNEEVNSVEELARLDSVYGIAIESDGHIIYASEDSIIRLKPTKHDCLFEKHTALNDIN